MAMLPPCPQAHFVYRDAAEVRSEMIRLGDVADLGMLPAALRARAGAIVLPWRAVHDGSIDRMAVSSAVRSRMPILACSTPETPGQISLHVVRLPKAADTVPQPRIEPDVRPGDRLDLSVAVGPVRVERRVTALQPARLGGRLFVADADGKPLSVRYLQVRP